MDISYIPSEKILLVDQLNKKARLKFPFRNREHSPANTCKNMSIKQHMKKYASIVFYSLRSKININDFVLT
jgi:hypothetical protein